MSTAPDSLLCFYLIYIVVEKVGTGRRFNPRSRLWRSARGRFSPRFGRPETMEGLKEGRKNKLGRLEKAIASDDSMIDMTLGHYIRYEEIESLTFKRKTNGKNMLEKPESRTKQELDVEYEDLYAIVCETCRETHGKCGKKMQRTYFTAFVKPKISIVLTAT